MCPTRWWVYLTPPLLWQGWSSEAAGKVTLEGLAKAAATLMEEDDMAVRAGATKLRDLASSAQH